MKRSEQLFRLGYSGRVVLCDRYRWTRLERPLNGLRRLLGVFIAIVIGLFLQSGAPILVSAKESLSVDASISKLIKLGDLNGAEKMAATELQKNPNNADAHYLLGNVYLRLGNMSDATREFTSASRLDSRGQAGMLSRMALFTINRKNQSAGDAGSNANGPKVDGSGVAGSGSTASASAEKAKSSEGTASAEERERLVLSANRITQDAAARQHKLTAEYEAEKARIEQDANNLIQSLQTQLQSSLNENGVRVRGYDPTGANAAAREQFEASIKAVRERTQAELDKLSALYRTKADALEQSAVGLGTSFSQSKGKVMLSPLGSSIFVRNYQTTDTASDEAVPERAPPAKALPHR